MNKNERITLSSDLLRSFLMIAETGNLTHAAEKLGRTQSAISVQLRNLEQTLGVALFERSVKGMRLTSAGERLWPKAKHTVMQMQEMQRLFEVPLTGKLRIGIPDDYEGHVLTEALARFARTHPDVEVTAISGCTAAYPQAVHGGELDMAICSGPGPIGKTLVSKEPVVWATSQSSKITASDPVPLAMLDRNCWWKSIPTNALQKSDRQYRITFRTESFGSLLASLRSNFAVGVLPASCMDEDMRILGMSHGFPSLPEVHRSMIFSSKADQDITDAMAEAIQESLPPF